MNHKEEVLKKYPSAVCNYTIYITGKAHHYVSLRSDMKDCGKFNNPEMAWEEAYNKCYLTKKEGYSWEDFDKKVSELLKDYFLIKVGKRGLRLARKLYNQNYTPQEASGLILINI